MHWPRGEGLGLYIAFALRIPSTTQAICQQKKKLTEAPLLLLALLDLARENCAIVSSSPKGTVHMEHVQVSCNRKTWTLNAQENTCKSRAIGKHGR